MLSDAELSHIRYESRRYLTDQLTHLQRSVTTGTYGEQVGTYATVATWTCGFAYSPFKFRSREVIRGDRTGVALSEILVRVRMPEEAKGTIDTDDRVVLTHKFGKALPELQIYEVQGFEELTIYGFILNLRRTEV